MNCKVKNNLSLLVLLMIVAISAPVFASSKVQILAKHLTS